MMNVDEMIAHAEMLSEAYDDRGRFRNTTDRIGSYRTVIVEGGYAFKAMLRNDRDPMNRAEWDFYASASDEMRAKLAKPLYLSRNGNVIVMEVLKVNVWGETPEMSTEVANMAKELHNVIIGDLHGGNFGTRSDGTMVVSDYGHILFEGCEEGIYNKTKLGLRMLRMLEVAA